ncbi:glycosyl hydrolase family 8 [Moorena producens JHB]|uniref:Glycosyl hydrolase family 8 n=1 Tax=Moorena producens (strain JHB) TaxID=1454205 RepID=A0A1D9GAJ7_MOOP1|nr:glycosyl hydrolase family 8 [Moorena producens]AOY84676.2 glycosyl hydrolase family 8 [Moorena producens JHB]
MSYNSRQRLFMGRTLSVSIVTLTIMLSLLGCAPHQLSRRSSQTASPPQSSPGKTSSVYREYPEPDPPNTALPIDESTIIAQSWSVYKEKFIQKDGRVIDYEASDRSTSEGQAYGMLRAVIADDPTTFALTLQWSQNNLKRSGTNGTLEDQLWVWKWGRDQSGNWGAIDRNFASDADIDAATALILASRRWNRPEYLELALTKLEDLWNLSTKEVRGKRYLLPGPVAAFVPSPSTLYLNPSYLAPFSFRLFAQVDSNHDWLSLVDSSYQVLKESSQVSAVGLPSDWIALDTETGQFQPLPPESPLKSSYSFDAYRVWWRVAWDAAWFNTPEAFSYLSTATQHLQSLWRSSSRLPARIDIQGKPTVTYEATSQYAMLYSALRLIEPAMARELIEQKLIPQYHEGIWDDQSAYYTQNLAWLGLLPTTAIDRNLLNPS